MTLSSPEPTSSPLVIIDLQPPVAVVRLNRPEVLNALSPEMLSTLSQTLASLDDDGEIRVIVLAGNGRAFCAGADIQAMASASPVDILSRDTLKSWLRIRSLNKPLIAAVHGVAYGGGCELALTCDLIVAAENARFAQPEIKLGIMPGAGGTQRLSKAIGPYRAMEMVLTGEPLSAQEAFAHGLVNRLVPPERCLEEALELARDDRLPTACRSAPGAPGPAPRRRDHIEGWHADRAAQLPAPVRHAGSKRGDGGFPGAQGPAVRREVRACKEWNEQLMTIQFITPFSVRIGVLGAGTMGSGIALTILLADMPVTLYDVSAEMLEKAKGYIESHLERKGKSDNIAYLNLTSHLDDLSSAMVLIEAAPEDLALKQEIFAALDRICPPSAILATNTSTLPVTAIAAATEQPQRVAGMHFFNPAPVMPLVEVIQGVQTHPDTIQSLVALASKLGKTSVVARDTPGFIVNRVARPFYGEALRILGEGVTTYDKIDQIVRLGGGFRMGPFELMDLIGIDVNLAAMQSMYQQTHGEPRYKPHLIQDQMVQQKALGRKSGRGFYDYSVERQPEEVQLAPVDPIAWGRPAAFRLHGA